MITVVPYLKTPELHWRGCCHSDRILWLFRSTSSPQMAARHKQKFSPMSNYLIMENTFFQFHFLSFRMFFQFPSECSSSLSQLLNSLQDLLNLTQESIDGSALPTILFPPLLHLPPVSNNSRLAGLCLCLPHEWINIFISTLSQFSIKDE